MRDDLDLYFELEIQQRIYNLYKNSTLLSLNIFGDIGDFSTITQINITPITKHPEFLINIDVLRDCLCISYNRFDFYENEPMTLISRNYVYSDITYRKVMTSIITHISTVSINDKYVDELEEYLVKPIRIGEQNNE